MQIKSLLEIFWWACGFWLQTFLHQNTIKTYLQSQIKIKQEMFNEAYYKVQQPYEQFIKFCNLHATQKFNKQTIEQFTISNLKYFKNMKKRNLNFKLKPWQLMVRSFMFNIWWYIEAKSFCYANSNNSHHTGNYLSYSSAVRVFPLLWNRITTFYVWNSKMNIAHNSFTIPGNLSFNFTKGKLLKSSFLSANIPFQSIPVSNFFDVKISCKQKANFTEKAVDTSRGWKTRLKLHHELVIPLLSPACKAFRAAQARINFISSCRIVIRKLSIFMLFMTTWITFLWSIQLT